MSPKPRDKKTLLDMLAIIEAYEPPNSAQALCLLKQHKPEYKDLRPNYTVRHLLNNLQYIKKHSLPDSKDSKLILTEAGTNFLHSARKTVDFVNLNDLDATLIDIPHAPESFSIQVDTNGIIACTDTVRKR